MSGFGSGAYGDSLYGDGESESGEAGFDLVEVNPIDYRTVDLAFSDPLSESETNAALIGLLTTYVVSPSLQIVAAAAVSDTVIRVFTAPQNPGATYRVIIGSDLRDTDEEALGVKTGTWVAMASPTKYLVTNLVARTLCVGRAIYLSWTLPSGATRVKIVRRLKAWPFDLTDSHDVVYDGVPISEFIDSGIVVPSTLLTAVAAKGDTAATVASSVGFTTQDSLRFESLTGPWRYDIVPVTGTPDATHVQVEALSNAYPEGARVSRSSELQDQTYYYYTVLVDNELGDSHDYDLDDTVRVFALSSAPYNGAQWFRDRATRYSLERDAKPVEQGGGGGFLTKWMSVMGCWLNLMRSHLNAIGTSNDPDQAPFHTLAARNQTLGIEAEGFAYDFDIVRRPLTSLVYVYKRKGTCPGIVETVRMFTKWDASCVEFGFNECASGAGGLKTWDGVSTIDVSEEADGDAWDMKVTSADGSGTITDDSKTWADDLWISGTIQGALGDIVCVNTNVNNVISTKAPTKDAVLTALVPEGTLVIPVSTTKPFYPGMKIQLTASESLSDYPAELVEVYGITPGVPGSLELRVPTSNEYPAGSMVSIGKTVLDREYYADDSTQSSQTLTEDRARWVEGQWIGMKLLDSANVVHTVVSNTATEVVVDGVVPAAGEFAIAWGFVVGATFDDRVPLGRFKVWFGERSTTFDPMLDIELRGTVHDPYNRTYNGPGLPLSGVYGPADVAAYILTKVPVGEGRAQADSVSGFVFTLDPYQPAPAPNEWKGYFFNPNQNQEQMFEILENTSTQLLIAGDVRSLVYANQRYYVLKPRDKVRFQRVVRRLRKEFTDADTKIHVLFS